MTEEQTFKLASLIAHKKLPYGGLAGLHITLDANASHAVINLLAEAFADAWDEGWVSRATRDPIYRTPDTNPYRT